VLSNIAKLCQALLVLVAEVPNQLVALAHDGLRAQVLAAAAWPSLREWVGRWVVHARPLDSLAEAVLI